MEQNRLADNLAATKHHIILMYFVLCNAGTI